MPLLGTFRPLVPGVGPFSTVEWTPRAAGRGTVDGRECVIVDFTHASNAAMSKRIWVAPDMDWSILRFSSGKRLQMDVNYEKDDEERWLPQRWTINVLSPDRTKIERAEAAEVERIEINAVVNANELALEFPSGTEVIDHSSGEKLPTTYIARGNGERRIITWEERRREPSYRELLDTESGEAKGKTRSTAPGGTGLLYISVGAGFVLVILCVAYLLRRADAKTSYVHGCRGS